MGVYRREHHLSNPINVVYFPCPLAPLRGRAFVMFFAFWVGWGGVGECNNVASRCLTYMVLHWCYVDGRVGCGGVGWGGVITLLHVAWLIWCRKHLWTKLCCRERKEDCFISCHAGHRNQCKTFILHYSSTCFDTYSIYHHILKIALAVAKPQKRSWAI